MHKKFSQQGLVVVTVSIDPPEEKSKVEEANAFLRTRNPPFVNLHLDEPGSLWKPKLDFNSPPCYFLFDRQGKWTRIRGSDYDNDELVQKLDETILRMLKEK